jgi:serine/threonine protein kinase
VILNAHKYPRVYKENKLYLEEDQVCSIMRELLGAVSYAHKKGIIHIDIKPDNIVL